MTIGNVLLVACGGAIGAVCRYTVGELVKPAGVILGALPTWIVNVVGSLLIGLLFGWLMSSTMSGDAKSNVSLFLMTGVLGGFTTFSSFSLDCLKYFMSGHYCVGMGYVLLSVSIGIAVAALGYKIGFRG